MSVTANISGELTTIAVLPTAVRNRSVTETLTSGVELNRTLTGQSETFQRKISF